MRTMALTHITFEALMTVLFIFMHESPIYYYSALPDAYKTTTFFLVMLAYEPFTNVFFLAILFFSTYMQAAYFNAVSRRLEKWLQDLRYDFL